MATLLPTLNTCLPRMTSGERRFARCLESKLEEDYLCWYDVPLGPRRLHPDFAILHPRRGLLILEVKDWKLDTIQSLDPDRATLLTAQGQVRVPNPLEQARQYCHVLVGLLQRDPALLQDSGPYQGKLRFAWGYGVVLANITRQQFERTDLSQVLPANRVICKDEMQENSDAEAFQQRLWDMFSVRFDRLMSMPEVERVRWHLFPELRLEPTQTSLFAESDSPADLLAALPDLVRVMDLQQEQLARSLGDGHRIIHGVAGSGKTMILGYRCLKLAQALHKPILALCYNRTLAAKLAHMIVLHGLAEKVSVQHFHGWCAEQLRLYQVAAPSFGPHYWKDLANRVLGGLDSGQIPSGQYGAILIDEGHDFEPDWLRLVVRMVDPSTESLLVLYDDAQAIYGNRRQFSFSSVGIQARGRTTILRLNYRNTAQVLQVALDFAREWLSPQEAEDDGVPLIPPESAGRHGPAPRWQDCLDEAEEYRRIGEFLEERQRREIAWNEMAVLCRTNQERENVARRLQTMGIPVELAGKDTKRAFDPAADSVKIVTLHASKGLEFKVIAIPGIGRLPLAQADSEADEARLLYVGMTRAMDHLLLTASADSVFARRLRQIAQGAPQAAG
ncbi:3'-5' exonuclease [Pseudomonas sp. RIT-PI-AD]|uniref:DEAD/DEAH box helicase n=1 Tax=Pseudomonas sp. RIT-PI-AD TaxID=3035294 RepID=UPI0021D80D29|nr:3'-5' exonuclease [Pseudomonas sp. RIT-PI-AD]